MISPYLLRPLRSLEQVERDLRRARERAARAATGRTRRASRHTSRCETRCLPPAAPTPDFSNLAGMLQVGEPPAAALNCW